MTPTKKYILEAAKQNMVDDIDKKIAAFEETWQRLDSLRNELEDPESLEYDNYTAQMCKCNEASNEEKLGVEARP